MSVTVEFEVFCVVTLCSDVAEYQRLAHNTTRRHNTEDNWKLIVFTVLLSLIFRTALNMTCASLVVFFSDKFP
jgi:hypothetical protein